MKMRGLLEGLHLNAGTSLISFSMLPLSRCITPNGAQLPLLT